MFQNELVDNGHSSNPHAVLDGLTFGDEHLDDVARAISASSAFVADASPRVPEISVVITAHNEGLELRRTVASVAGQTRRAFEIVLVNDGSSDGSTDGLRELGLRVIDNGSRVGVAHSRNTGCAAARGDVFAFLDGHQRLSDGCLDLCAEVARERQAVVWPDVCKLDGEGWMGHGGKFRLCPKQGYFSAAWCHDLPAERVSVIDALVAPGYVMPRGVYEKLHWIHALRGWGGSEAAIGLKAFFLNVPVLHLCGPVARHLFRPSFPYATTWNSIWRNHALIARVCFSGDTWHRFWLPKVFDTRLSDELRRELESDQVRNEHQRFQQLKRRCDEEFWSHLIRRPIPTCLLYRRSLRFSTLEGVV